LNEIIWRRGGERQLEAIATGHERFIDAAHDVDLRPFIELLFAPDHRVVEHVVACGLEAAFQHRRITGIQYYHMTLCQHRHATTYTYIRIFTARCYTQSAVMPQFVCPQ